MAAFEIRAASDADYDALVPLIEEGDAPHRMAHPEVFRKPDGPVREREHIRKLVSDPERALLVATAGHDLIGFIHAKIDCSPELPIMVPRQFATIDNLVVARGHRHKGIAMALIRAAETWAKNKGVCEIELNVWEFNSPARSLYEFLQYQTISRKMRKTVKPAAPKPDTAPESN